jgi:hypothetical protein
MENHFHLGKGSRRNYGNELANKLAKEAAKNDDISFNITPKSEIVQQVRDQSIAVWTEPQKGQQGNSSSQSSRTN